MQFCICMCFHSVFFFFFPPPLYVEDVVLCQLLKLTTKGNVCFWVRNRYWTEDSVSMTGSGSVLWELVAAWWRRGYFILLRECGSNIKSQLLVTPLTNLDVFLYENNSAYLSLLSLQTPNNTMGRPNMPCTSFLFPIAQQLPQTHLAEQPRYPREHLRSWP